MKKFYSAIPAMLTGIIFTGCCCLSGPEAKSAANAPAPTPAKPAAKVSILLAGDSTCASYSAERAPLTGWGQVLGQYCREGVTVRNHAISGRSTLTFIRGKAWDKLVSEIKPGDYVVVQFGHNDGSKRNNRYTDPATTYRDNLRKFIADVRARKANPIIATSIARCTYKKGKLDQGYIPQYVQAAIEVAKEENVPCIDFNGIMTKEFNTIGEAAAFKNYLGRVKVPAKPATAKTPAKPATVRIDRVHLNRIGALKVAEIFVNDCKAQKLPIADCFK